MKEYLCFTKRERIERIYPRTDTSTTDLSVFMSEKKSHRPVIFASFVVVIELYGMFSKVLNESKHAMYT